MMGKTILILLLATIVPAALIIFLTQRDRCVASTQLHKIGITKLVFNDTTRSRELITTLWYPVAEDEKVEPIDYAVWIGGQAATNAPISNAHKHYPFIFLSHGYGGDWSGNSWIAELLAAHGFIVGAIDHYGNTHYNMLLQWSIRPFARAQDISFVLDQLRQDPVWGPKIDINKIGMIGFSQGGAAGLWLAGARANFTDIEKELLLAGVSKEDFAKLSFADKDQLEKIIANLSYEEANGFFKDDRIKAVFLMAPGLGGENSYFKPAGLAAITIPVYIIAGAADEIVPIKSNAEFFATHINNAQLTILPGNVSHWVFMNRGTELGKKLLPHLTIDDASIDRAAIHKQVGNLAVQFFKQSLRSSIS
jgi:predicted dienelactone hydrolase